MAALFLFRGMREERLSDKMLGLVMFLMAQEMQDYTFGFSGINFLWNEMNGFPRGVALLFGPTVYFYLKTQTNRSFRFQRQHLWHLLPWVAFFVLGLFFFVQGPEAVQHHQSSSFSTLVGYISTFVGWASYAYYFYLSLKLYNQYRNWSLQQFSDVEIISFSWFRNFIVLMIFWVSCKEIMSLIDWAIDLDFYQDWWWNLPLVAAAIYIGLTGFAQKQPSTIFFTAVENGNLSDENEVSGNPIAGPPLDDQASEYKKLIAERLSHLMTTERLFLQPELSLNELAKHLKTNSSLLSAAINQVVQQNFNDYINNLRVEEFIKNLSKEENQSFTLLSIAYESGFNSKATFNRAFKKSKGCTPRQYVNKQVD